MRAILLATALGVLAPAAFAQSYPPSYSAPANPSTTYPIPSTTYPTTRGTTPPPAEMRAPPMGYSGTPRGDVPSGAPYGASPSGAYGGSQASMHTAQPDPANCGTPDEPKSCPPMPRRPLNYYPDNRR